MKRSIIGGNLNLPIVEWKGVVDVTNVTRTFINWLLWDNVNIQVVGKLTRGDSLLDIHLVRPEGELITCETVQGIRDHCGVLLDVEWGGTAVRLRRKDIPVYHKISYYILGLSTIVANSYSVAVH